MGADRTFSVFRKYVKKNSKEFGFTKGKRENLQSVLFIVKKKNIVISLDNKENTDGSIF